MKTKEFKQLKDKPEADLKKMLGELKDRLWNFRKDLAAGKVKNVREIHKVKKDIARVLTLLNQK
jgi:large subunit ribosomal protein L29